MLWAQVIKAKYFLGTSLFKSARTPRGSHIWKALFDGIQWLWNGMKWIVGDRQTMTVWDDHWIPRGTLWSRIARPLMQNEENCRVSSLRNNHTWTFYSLHVPFPTQLEHLIRGIPMAQITKLSDSFVWPHNNGIC